MGNRFATILLRASLGLAVAWPALLPEAAEAATSPGPYNIRRVGLYGSGIGDNTAQFLTLTGRSVGFTSSNFGLSAWLDDGSNTTEIGLVDAAHTDSSGHRNNRAVGVSTAALTLVGGNADRNIGGVGRSAWVYTAGASTTEIGLTDAAHTRSDGYQLNTLVSFNLNAQAAGIADRYSSAGYQGQSAWIYSGGVTQETGLLDFEHTSTSGYRYSSVQALNQSGEAIGQSQRLILLNDRGYSGWLYQNGIATEIGLLDAAHTQPNGYRNNWPRFLSDSGRVAGQATRYSGTADLGQSAWVYNGSSATEIGLVDAAHTSSGGTRNNAVAAVNNAGAVTGTADLYSGATNLGQSAWLSNGSSTQEIGLNDAAHKSPGGQRQSIAQLLNSSSQAAGFADRYSGSVKLGHSAWFFNGLSPIEIGLTDAAHTNNDGTRDNQVTFLTDSGLLAGTASKYAGGSIVASTPWIYDSQTAQTYTLEFEVSAGGFSKTIIQYLGEDGVALGTYRRYNGFSSLGDFAFYWSPGGGFYDLGQLVGSGGLSANGWSRLATAININGLGEILGDGVPTSGSPRASYVLTPIPEPATSLLILTPGAVLLARRNRKSLGGKKIA